MTLHATQTFCYIKNHTTFISSNKQDQKIDSKIRTKHLFRMIFEYDSTLFSTRE